MLRKKTKPALEKFSWKAVWDELQENAPTLLSLICSLFPVLKCDQEDIQPAVCMIISILLYNSNQKVNLLQSVVGLILRAGHSTKQARESFFLLVL